MAKQLRSRITRGVIKSHGRERPITHLVRYNQYTTPRKEGFFEQVIPATSETDAKRWKKTFAKSKSVVPGSVRFKSLRKGSSWRK